MARKATGRTGASKSKQPRSGTKSSSRAVARRSSGSSGGRGRSQDSMGEAFIKLLQSPLVAELVAVAATAALASLAEQGFSSRGGEGTRGRRAGKAVKAAGQAAASAIGRRLGTEIEEIKKAAKTSKGGAATRA